MASLFLLLIFLILFHRELLFLFCYLLADAKKLPRGDWDLELKARGMKTRVYLSASKSMLEAFSLNTLLFPACFVAEELWNEWSSEDKTAYLFWCHAFQMKATTLERLLRYEKISVIDRDALLLLEKPLSLIDSLEKAAIFRNSRKNELSPVWSWLGGLSFVGQPFFESWPSIEDRLKTAGSFFEALAAEKV